MKKNIRNSLLLCLAILLTILIGYNNNEEKKCESGLSLIGYEVDLNKEKYAFPTIIFEFCMKNNSSDSVFIFIENSFVNNSKGNFFLVNENDTCELVNLYLPTKILVEPSKIYRFTLSTFYCSLSFKSLFHDEESVSRILKKSKIYYLTDNDTIPIE